MAIISARVYGETYTVGDTVHYSKQTGGSFENILSKIIKHRNGTYTFVMMGGEKVRDYNMIASCGRTSESF